MTNRKTPRKYFLMYFAFALSVSLTQCSKTTVDPIGLPPETQTGAGIFACKINGVVWQYKNPNYEFLSTKPVTHWEFDKSSMGGYLTINGLRYPDGTGASDYLLLVADSLNFRASKIVDTSTIYNYGIEYINYNSSKKECYEYRTTNALDKTKQYYSTGNLNITKLDQVARIISGNFNCVIFQTACGDTLRITEGRFDIKYQ